MIAGQYRLAEEIGRGGFGVVWRARDERLHRDVAAKELFLPNYLAEDQRQERRRRSLREARSAARIVHPSAVTVYDVVEHDGAPWIIMELIDGRALNSIVKTDGPLAPRRAAEIGLEVLGALQAAHAAGVVHRDVKPGNVLINEKRVVLTDFGIATIEGDPTLTHSGFVMGAPAYTAPERARGETAIPASDLWSLGATLFYAVEGHRPYPGPNANAVFHAILNDEPATPRHAGALTPIIDGLLRKDVTERFTAPQTAALLRQLVESPQRTPADTDTTYYRPISRPERTHPTRRLPRRTSRGILAATAAALVLSLSMFMWPDTSPDKPARNHLRVPTQPRLLTTLTDAPDKLNAIAFSKDGQSVAAGGEDGVVRIWNIPQRRQIAALKGHSYAVFSIAFSPDGRTLASGGYDKSVVLWDLARHTRLATLFPNEGAVSSLAFSPDGKLLAGAGADGVRLWNMTNRKTYKTLGSPTETQFIAAFGSAGLAVAGTGTLRLWNAASRPQTTLLGPMTSLIRAMAISPNGTVVACGGDNGQVALWDARTRKRLGRLAHDRSVSGVAFAPDGRILATASGKTITLWNLASQTMIAALPAHTALVSSIAYSPDGRMLASASYDKTVRLWATPAPAAPP